MADRYDDFLSGKLDTLDTPDAPLKSGKKDRYDAFLSGESDLTLESERKKPDGLILPAVKRSVGGAVADIGQLVGARGMKAYGERLEEENPQQIAFEDAASRPVGFVGETVAETVPGMLPVLTASLYGGYKGAKAGSVFGPKGAVIGSILGGTAAGWAAGFPQTKGRIQRRREEKGLEPGGYEENVAALASSGVESLGGGASGVFTKIGRGIATKTLAKTLSKEGAEQLAAREAAEKAAATAAGSVGARLGYIGKQTLKTGLGEAGEEVVQDPIENWATHDGTTLSGLAEAFVKGFIGGGVFGGAFSAYNTRAAARVRNRLQVKDEIDQVKSETENLLGIEETGKRAEYDRGVLSGLGEPTVTGTPRELGQADFAELAKRSQPAAPEPFRVQKEPRDFLDDIIGKPMFDEEAQRKAVLEGIAPAAPKVSAPASQPLTSEQLDDIVQGGPDRTAVPGDTGIAVRELPVTSRKAKALENIPLDEQAGMRVQELPVFTVREQGRAVAVQPMAVENIVYPPTFNPVQDLPAWSAGAVNRRAAELEEKRPPAAPPVDKTSAFEQAERDAELAKRVQEEALASEARKTRLAEAADRVVAEGKVPDRLLPEDIDNAINGARVAAEMKQLPVGIREKLHKALRAGPKSNRALQIAGLRRLLAGMDTNTRSYEIAARVFERITGRSYEDSVQSEKDGGRPAVEGKGTQPVPGPGAAPAVVPSGSAEVSGAAEVARPPEKSEAQAAAEAFATEVTKDETTRPAGTAAAEPVAAETRAEVRGPETAGREGAAGGVSAAAGTPKAGKRPPRRGEAAVQAPASSEAAAKAEPAAAPQKAEEARLEERGPEPVADDNRNQGVVSEKQRGIVRLFELAGKTTVGVRARAINALNKEGLSVREATRAIQAAVERINDAKETKNAVQEPSAEGVPVRQQPEGGEGVRRENAKKREAAKAREPVKARVSEEGVAEAEERDADAASKVFRKIAADLEKQAEDRVRRDHEAAVASAKEMEENERKDAEAMKRLPSDTKPIDEPLDVDEQPNSDAARKSHKGEVFAGKWKYVVPSARGDNRPVVMDKTLAQAERDGGRILMQWYGDVVWAMDNENKEGIKPSLRPIINSILTHPEVTPAVKAIAQRRYEQLMKADRERVTRYLQKSIVIERNQRMQARRAAAKKRKEERAKSGEAKVIDAKDWEASHGKTAPTRTSSTPPRGIATEQDEDYDPFKDIDVPDLEAELLDYSGFNEDFYNRMTVLFKAHPEGVPVQAVVRAAHATTKSSMERMWLAEVFYDTPFDTVVKPVAAIDIKDKFAVKEELAELKKKKKRPTDGHYDPKKDVISLLLPTIHGKELVLAGGMSTRTFLHELIHAAIVHRTSYGVYAFNNGIGVKNMTAEQWDSYNAVKELIYIYEQVREHATIQDIKAYAFTNFDEFLTEALTSPSFQMWLRGIEYKGDPLPTYKSHSFWDRIVNNFRRLFGFFTKNEKGETISAQQRRYQNDMMDAILSHTPDLFRVGTPDFDNIVKYRNDSARRGFYVSDPHLIPDEYKSEKQLRAEARAARRAARRAAKAAAEEPTPPELGFTSDRSHGAMVDNLSQGGKDLSEQVEKRLVNTSKDTWVNLKDSTRRGLFQAMSLKGIIQSFERYFPGLRQFGEVMSKQRAIAQERNMRAAKMINDVHAWAKKHGGWNTDTPGSVEEKGSIKTQPQILYNLMEQSTLHGIDPDVELHKQVTFEDKQEYKDAYGTISSLWERMDGEGRAHYRRLRDYNKRMHEEIHDQVANNIFDLFAQEDLERNNPVPVTTEEKISAMANGRYGNSARGAIKDMQNNYKKIRGPYFHLGRYGEHFIRWQAEEGEGPAQQFEMYENKSDWLNRVAELTKQGYNDKSKYPSWQAGKISERIESLDQGSWKFVRSMLERIDSTDLDKETKDTMKATVRQLYLQMLPETSSQKMFAKRHGVLGWDRDMIRNFAKRSEIANYNIAYARTAKEMSDSLGVVDSQIRKMQKSGNPSMASLSTMGSDIVGELRTRNAQLMKQPNTPIIDKLNAFNYSFYLALSPAYMLVNMLQPYQITLPVVGAKFGFVKTALEMARNAGTAYRVLKHMAKSDLIYPNMDVDELVKDKVLTVAQGDFLKSALSTGRIDITLAHELGEVRKHGATSKYNSIMHIAGLGSHYTEVFNRVTAGLAAFNLASKTMDKDKAIAYSNRIIDSTQFDYTSQNLARLMGKHGIAGEITPIFMAFQRYNAQSLELISRLTLESFGKLRANETEMKEARKALAGLFMTTGALAGMLGLPAMGLITAAIDKIFGDDDEPLDSKAAVRNFLADSFGKETAEVLARGGPRALGIDLSSRVGYDNIVPFTRWLADKRALKDSIEAHSLDAMGPLAGAATNMVLGAHQVMDGDTMKGLERLLPIAPLRNAAKAAEFANGYATDPKGNRLPVDLNGWDIMNQLLGFTPRPMAERSEALYTINTNTRQLQETSGKLRQKMYRALEANDMAEIDSVKSDIIEFNMKNPAFAITGVAQGYQRRARVEEVARKYGPGVGVSSVKHLPRLEIGKFANLDQDDDDD